MKYGKAKVFTGEDIKPVQMRDPVIVCKQDEEIKLNEDEMNVLRLGPKFCEFVNLDEESFEVEIEQTILKYKWETINDEKGEDNGMDAYGDPSILAREILFRELFTPEELEDMDEEDQNEMDMKEAEMRMVFDMRTGTLDMRKRRTTDLKGNSRVILPRKMRQFDEEAKLEMVRQELRGTMNRYMREKCGKNGRQKSNLTLSEMRGLKSLKTRIKGGEIVVLKTDKTGLFAIMSRETYTECGLQHTKGDNKVDWDDLKKSQNEINGHTSMMIKILGIGEAWKHTNRVRETMLGEAMTSSPLSLLFKDHKKWDKKKGSCPPTRPVMGGHLGMNLHLSEIISDVVEPLVDTYQGGRENISTEDMIARFVTMNEDNIGWTSWSWWEGLVWNEYIACSRCVGEWSLKYDKEVPEMCSCMWVVTKEQAGLSRVTARWLKFKRRVEWEQANGWEHGDMERTLLSTDVLPEDLQDYQNPMVVLGMDVVSLYPNLDMEKVGDRVKEAVKKSTIKWEGINYMEAVRYIALNWSEEKCRGSNLRKFLPWRRKNNGTRPGIRGAGPRGPECGDTEQWVFPRVVLKPEDKLEILGTVLSIAVTELFKHHYYSFGGATYRQNAGGPIGLRATCAIARLVMQIFDEKWEGVLKRLNIVTWLITRYMDDGRTAMPPFKPGWRMVDKELKFKLRWEKEDQELSPLEITKRVIGGTLEGVEEFLEFTVETGEDFEDMWLPTLDVSLFVDRSNKVLHRFFEKPTSSNITVQRRTAMAEDAKVQIVSNDLIRRLLNNSEELGEGARVKVVDDYAQKLTNSGYRGEQLRRIIANGIKGYEGRRRRCIREGRRLHRSSVDSQGARIRKKLLAKTNWFKKKRKGDRDSKDQQQGGRGGAHSRAKDREQAVKSILFVEQSPGGELAKRMRETLRSMEPTMGFRIKVVERCGQALGSKFPLTNLWEGNTCGREACVTCNQGGEYIPDCSRKNLMYENICISCNPGAAGGEKVEQVKDDIPTLYVGETSRSIFERGKEHWEGAKKGAENNHMVRHVKMEHKDEGAPNFSLRVVKHYKTALARQVAEAVRIRRRGGEGAILNSRGEFNRSYIPRLMVKEEDEEKDRHLRIEEKKLRCRTLREQDVTWEQLRREEMGDGAKMGPTTSPVKRSKEQLEGGCEGVPKKRRKKLKYEVLGADWGEQEQAQGAPQYNVEPQHKMSPAIPREQEPIQEAPLNSVEPQVNGSPAIYGEQKLKQRRISEFLNPGAPAELPESSPTGGRAPWDLSTKKITKNCTDESGDDISFVVVDGGSDTCTEVVGNKTQNDVLARNTDKGVLCTDGTTITRGNTMENKPLATPSGGEKSELDTRESKTSASQSVSQGLEFGKMNSGTKCESIDMNECEFKRGGMCKTHLVKGMKVVTKSKEWVKMKNGLFGYVTKQLTTYRCSRSAVFMGQPSPTIVSESGTELDSGLRLGQILPGDNPNWVCGVDIGGAGAIKDKSESSE